ncbi:MULTISPECIES: hypothetical protein [Microcoleaceae]|uniref:hypothetical protein n=1 Tax=Microcoleaceae TaxID=1892252 RepID=UPI002FD78AEA
MPVIETSIDKAGGFSTDFFHTLIKQRHRFYPISQKYTPNKPGILTIVKGCNKVFS